MNIKHYISTYFLIRHYLHRDIKGIVEKYNFKGKLIDVGCGSKPYKHLFKNISSYNGIDFKEYSLNKDFVLSKPDFFFDEEYLQNQKLNFADDYFDIACCFQVLEHCKNPKFLIEEMLRIAKESGYVMISFPFIYGLHEIPNDYFRFTEFGLAEMIKDYDCKISEVRKQGGVCATIYNILNCNLNYFASKNKVNYFMAIMVFPLLIIFQYITLVLDGIFNKDVIFSNYLILIKKK